jgi:hypothetical protein
MLIAHKSGGKDVGKAEQEGEATATAAAQEGRQQTSWREGPATAKESRQAGESRPV